MWSDGEQRGVSSAIERRASPILPSVACGFGVGATIGAVVGLVVGLAANPRTALFAVFETGIPGAVVGCLVGLFVGTAILLGRWLMRAARR